MTARSVEARRMDEGFAEAKAITRFPAMPFPLYHHAKTTGIQRSPW